MKNWLFLISFLTIGIFANAQTTPTSEFRVANSTTAFDRNLPVGTQIYDIAARRFYVVTAPLASSATITTGTGSLKQIGDQVVDLSVGNISGTTLDVVASGTDATLPAVTGANAGLMTAADKLKLDGIAEGAGEVNEITISAAGAVMEKDYNANTMLLATTDDTPVAVDASAIRTFLGISSGSNKTVFFKTEIADDITTTVTLASAPQNVSNMLVAINGVFQQSGYSLSGSTITFTIPLLKYDYVNVTYTE